MTLNRRTFFTNAAAAAGCVWMAPDRVVADPWLGGPALGSYWRLVPGGAVPGGVVDDVIAIIQEVDATMSPYRAGSELTQINRDQNRDWTSLSEGMNTVLAAALDISARSGGAFDPTVGPLVAQYGFGPIRGGVGGGLDALDFTPGMLRMTGAGATLDLCGIAKGWALDRIVSLLDGRLSGSFLFELGGEVFARGAHPAGRPWRVAIDGTQQVLALDNMAVATSGVMHQSYRIGSRLYGHIIDPRIHEPARGSLFSVSVLASTAMEADAWATALFGRGIESGIDMATAQDLDAVFSFWDGSALRVVPIGSHAESAITDWG